MALSIIVVIPLLVLLIFPAFISTADAKIYIDDEYKFWIEYPDNWWFEDTKVVVEPYPGINEGVTIFPSFRDGARYWYNFASVTLMKNATITTYNEEQFTNILIGDLKNVCNLASFEVEGYICTNHKVIEIKNTVINGLEALQITDSWTEIYQEGQNSTKISMITDIIIENDLWQIDTISVIDKGNFTKTKQIPLTFKFLEESTYYQHDQNEIPEWVKNNAGWWADGSIKDESFIQGIQFLIKEGIIKIPLTTQSSESNSSEIPEWVKNNAGWWADKKIDDDSFIGGIQFLIKEGIIKI
jgi:hypothetical protein